MVDLVRALSPSFHPRGRLLLLFEIVYTATDPPLKLLRRIIPPLRIGSVAFDLGFLLLFIVIVILRNYAAQL